jgi:hypothetical protein
MFLFLIAGLGLATADVEVAQSAADRDSTAMPLVLLEGSQYKRQVFASDGTREEYQEVTVSRLQRTGDQATEAEVTFYNYNADGIATDTLRTTITCRNDAAQMAMNITALLRPAGSRYDVRVTGEDLRYPRHDNASSPLPDVNMEVRVEDGMIGFLGGKSRIHLRDRHVRPAPEGTPFTVQETLHMRFYVLGIKVRDRTYDLEETIAAPEGVVRLVLTGPEGYRTILEQIS